MSKHISKDHVQELNEKYGWFQFGDAQSDVSNAFANEAIEKYERIRSAAPELLEALLEYDDAFHSLDLDCRDSRVRMRAAVNKARAAIAKAT